MVLDPEQRRTYLDRILEMEGLPHVREDPLAAYCPISLTSVPEELKTYLKARQRALREEVLKRSGIDSYDPGSAPLSPDLDLTARPDEVYAVDMARVAGARFFVGHSILPSDGKGAEMEMAKTLNRISVILMDRRIRVSRMQPHRTIYLQYEDFDAQAPQFVPVFDMLRDFEPGMGFNGNVPVLLGFENPGRVVDLEEEVYREFPHLQYRYDGSVPILRLRAENPELFYEHKVLF